MPAYPMGIWIALIVLAVLIIIALVAAGVRRSRSAALRDRFGAEYDHAVRRAGKRSVAEQELINRTEEAKRFEIRPLSASERDGFRREWAAIEARFVDRPATAVVEADELIGAVMRTRGYPTADFDRYASLLSVDHAQVVEHYRAGHAIIEAHGRGSASTEELRQAMLHYRALFQDLVGTATDVERPVTGTIARDEERPGR